MNTFLLMTPRMKRVLTKQLSGPGWQAGLRNAWEQGSGVGPSSQTTPLSHCSPALQFPEKVSIITVLLIHLWGLNRVICVKDNTICGRVRTISLLLFGFITTQSNSNIKVNPIRASAIVNVNEGSPEKRILSFDVTAFYSQVVKNSSICVCLSLWPQFW